MSINKFVFFLSVLAIFLLGGCAGEEKSRPADWRDDWAVAEGFSLSIDTEGYRFPTAIAFVPRPGDEPKDPLYYVAEIRGTIKVVTNDRTVYTFAEGFSPIDPQIGLESHSDQFGLVGLCLAPEEGYLFATLSYRVRNIVVKNMVVRFESRPQTFSLEPDSYTQILDIFDDYEFTPNHQVGACQVHDGYLYIGSGDYEDRDNLGDPNSLFGKILRVNLDGSPPADNPFYQPGNEENPRNYVWAYGFRNPFGLEVAGGRFFVADNGLDIDRVLEVHESENYLWNGSDWSIGARADAVIAPAVGPTHIEYGGFAGTSLPPDYRDSFFFGAVGKFSPVAPEGILRLKYDFERGRLEETPEYFLLRRGDHIQPIVALAVGRDGVYFATLFPNSAGLNPVYRIAYDPDDAHVHVVRQGGSILQVMSEHQCLTCHSLQQIGGTTAPPLDQGDLITRLKQRLNSEEYLRSLDEVDQLDAEPYLSYAGARQQLRESEGLDRVRMWLQYRIQEPRFDNPNAQMPNLGITEEEAQGIAGLLMETPGIWQRAEETLRELLPRALNWWHLLYAFLGGVGAILFVVALQATGILRIRRRDP